MWIEILGLFFLIFTSLFGIASLLELLFRRLFDTEYERAVCVLPVRGREPRLEYLLRGALAQRRRAVLADYGMDAETAGIAARLASHSPALRVVRPEELAAALEAILAQQRQEEGAGGESA